MDTHYRAAVIATGRMSRAHGNAFKAIPNIDLVACADISQEAVNGFGEQYGIATAIKIGNNEWYVTGNLVT